MDLSFGGCPGVTKLTEESLDDQQGLSVDTADFPKRALLKLGGSTKTILTRQSTGLTKDCCKYDQ